MDGQEILRAYPADRLEIGGKTFKTDLDGRL